MGLGLTSVETRLASISLVKVERKGGGGEVSSKFLARGFAAASVRSFWTKLSSSKSSSRGGGGGETEESCSAKSIEEGGGGDGVERSSGNG